MGFSCCDDAHDHAMSGVSGVLIHRGLGGTGIEACVWTNAHFQVSIEIDSPALTIFQTALVRQPEQGLHISHGCRFNVAGADQRQLRRNASKKNASQSASMPT